MNWKINFLLTAVLTVITSSEIHVEGSLRNVSYNIPNIFQRREKERALLKSQLTIPTRRIEAYARNNFYKEGQSLANEFIPNVYKEYCKEQILIQSVTNYPTDYVNNKINDIIINFFIQSPEHLERNSQDNTGQPLQTRRLCKFKKKMLVPFAAFVIEDDECYFVVNRKVKPIQNVKYESCEYRSVDHRCDRNGILPLYEQMKPYDFTTSCNQTYIQRSLVVLDHYGKLRQKLIKVKAACVCTKTLKP